MALKRIQDLDPAATLISGALMEIEADGSTFSCTVQQVVDAAAVGVDGVLDSKADVADLDALALRVTGTESVNTVQDGSIAAAQAAADNALSVANTKAASTDVQALGGRVTTVEGNVATAQNTANAANTLAASKSKVLIQSAAPATADQSAQNLWIDTTSNANTPKRWTGSAWAAVTDKVATDAATAISALTGRMTSAESVNTAQTTRIDDAFILIAQGL